MVEERPVTDNQRTKLAQLLDERQLACPNPPTTFEAMSALIDKLIKEYKAVDATPEQLARIVELDNAIGEMQVALGRTPWNATERLDSLDTGLAAYIIGKRERTLSQLRFTQARATADTLLVPVGTSEADDGIGF